jgi:hypothetical protein
LAGVGTIAVVPERDATDDGVERRRRYIVCGDNSLSYRLIAELGALPDTDVVVVSRRRHGGASAVPATAPDIELINVDQLNEAAFQKARLRRQRRDCVPRSERHREPRRRAARA